MAQDELEQGWHYSPPAPAVREEEDSMKRLAAARKKQVAQAAPTFQLQGAMTQSLMPFLQAMAKPPRGGGPSPGGTGPGGPVPHGMMAKLAGANNIRGLARRIQSVKGGLYDVAELEGFEGQGPITGGHSAGSDHYSGRAFDVNTTRGNNARREDVALSKLYRAIKKLYGNQLGFTGGPWNAYPGHGSMNPNDTGHGHFSFNQRRF